MSVTWRAERSGRLPSGGDRLRLLEQVVPDFLALLEAPRPVTKSGSKTCGRSNILMVCSTGALFSVGTVERFDRCTSWAGKASELELQTVMEKLSKNITPGAALEVSYRIADVYRHNKN